MSNGVVVFFSNFVNHQLCPTQSKQFVFAVDHAGDSNKHVGSNE